MALDQHTLADRIRKAREGCRLTREQMAQSAGMTSEDVTRIETGMRPVDGLELARIAFAVGRDSRDFIEEEFDERDALSALFRSDPKLVGEGQLLTALQECLALGHQVANLEHVLGIERAEALTCIYQLPLPANRQEAIRQGEQIAAAERQRLDLGGAPVGDITAMLEQMGVRTGAISLPDEISGLTLCDKRVGVFILANANQPALRRRFSYAHELGHVLIDRNSNGTLSRPENSQSLIEVRANAFAAAFLMPEGGMRQCAAALGKNSRSAQQRVATRAQPAELERSSQDDGPALQVYDVARLAHYFGVSRTSILYRLRTLQWVGASELRRLRVQEKLGAGQETADLLGLTDLPYGPDEREDFRRRFLSLALEAYRREEITRSKLNELGRMIAVDCSAMQSALESTGLE